MQRLIDKGFDTGRFTQEAFSPKNYQAAAIANTRKIEDEEKIELGKRISRFTKNHLNAVQENNYYIEHAENYLHIAQERRLTMLQAALEEALELVDTDNPYYQQLINAIRNLKGLHTDTSWQESKRILDEGLTAILNLEQLLKGDKSKENALQCEKVDFIVRSLLSHGLIQGVEIETAKGLSQEAQKRMLEALFHTHVIPDLPEEGCCIKDAHYSKNALHEIFVENQSAKKRFLETHFNWKQAPLLYSQSKKEPLIQIAIDLIQENLNIWDTAALEEDRSQQESIKEPLKKQIRNLSTLSEIIAKISVSEGIYSATHSYMTYPPKILWKLGEYLDGEEEMDAVENQKDIELALQRTIIPSANERLALVAPHAISKENIAARAQLMKNKREGKLWASRQQKIPEIPGTVNKVFKLLHPKEGRTPVSYFKQSKEGDFACGTMEKLVYDIAEIMGMAKLFVPTGRMTLRRTYGLQAKSHNSSVMNYLEDGEFKRLENVSIGLKGGIQTALHGQTLSKEIEAKTAEDIGIQEVIDSTVASLVFCLQDAHSDNIIVVTEGIFTSNDGTELPVVIMPTGELLTRDGTPLITITKKNVDYYQIEEKILCEKSGHLKNVHKRLVFIDNTRCLPHSNGFIDDDAITAVYRCAILKLPQSRQLLSDVQIDALKRQIEHIQSNMHSLNEYLNNPLSKIETRINLLPYGWMDKEKALAAMEERVGRMYEALKSGKVKTLSDLIEKTIPYYRFACCLSILDKYKNRLSTNDLNITELISSAQMHVTFVDIEDRITCCANEGYDLALIKQWCDDDNISFEAVVSKLQDAHKKLRSEEKPLEKEQILALAKNAEAIKNEITAGAKIDFKDLDREFCTFFQNVINLNGMNVPFIVVEEKRLLFQASKEIILKLKNQESQRKLYILGCEEFQFTIFDTPIGPCGLVIDLKTKPGEVKIADTFMPIEDFVREYSDCTDPTYNMLLKLSDATMRDILKELPAGSVLMCKHFDRKTLSVGVQRQRNTSAAFVIFKCKPSKENPKKFIDLGKPKTLKEIYDNLQKSLKSRNSSK